jgi:hypothetical protein
MKREILMRIFLKLPCTDERKRGIEEAYQKECFVFH